VRNKIFALGCVFALMSCDFNALYWDLPRTNETDSLQNQNPLGANYPVARFSASSNEIALGGSVDFVSTSFNNPENHNWTFINGTPNASTEASQSVRYDRIGKYDVVLKVQNQYGSDSVVARNFVNAMYLKDFSNRLWDGWVSQGWVFTTSSACPGCILAWQNSSNSPVSFTVTRNFTDVPNGSKLKFYYQIQSPGGKITVKVNNAAIWSRSGYTYGEDVVIDMPPISNPTVTLEAEVSATQSVRLNAIKITL